MAWRCWRCHAARNSNVSDKNEAHTVVEYQLWHSQPHWKFVCDDVQYPLLCISSEILLSKYAASQNQLCQTTGSCFWTQKTPPLALKIIFVGIQLLLYQEETKPPQLYNNKTVKHHSQRAKKRQSSTKPLSAHIFLKVMLVYASKHKIASLYSTFV